MENKKRLIDASDWERYYFARKQSLDVYDSYFDGFEDALDRVDDWMDAQPTIDAVEVVRCERCYYWDKATVNSKGFLICPASGMDITPNDFCSYGERKDND